MIGRIVSWWRGTPVREAEPAGRTVEAAGGSDSAWRPVSQTNRDLPPMTQRRMQELAHHAWEQHRLANRLIELPLAFILGDGVEMRVDDGQAQDWLDAWWRDPITRLDLKLEQRIRELALFGEQVIVVFVRQEDGHIRHGAIDPAAIEDVILDPDNASLAIGIKVRSADGDERVYRVVLDGADDELLMPAALAERAKMTAGECHFWRINDLLTGKRGRSDLLSAIDLADAYTQLIFGEVERAVALRMVMWDVTLKGATEEQVAAKAREIQPPTPMSIRVHNDAEEWDAKSAKLESGDASGTLRTVRNEVLGGATLPEHWYGGGGDVNRATAAEMDEPTYKVFKRRQLLWKAILEAEARHVIRTRLAAQGRAADAGDDRYQPQAVFPEMQAVDVSRYAQALAQVVAAVAAAVNADLMTAETAVQLIASLAARFGVEIDAAAELKAAQTARDKRDDRDTFKPPTEPAADPTDDGPAMPQEPAA